MGAQTNAIIIGTLLLLAPSGAATTHAARSGGVQSELELRGNEVIGLYIGVGGYTDPTVRPLTVHRTNHEVLVPLMTRRLGVQWLDPVMDDRATRDGIRDGLIRLLTRVREARDAGREVTAVLFYTGHGSQVRDQDGDEPDGRDETWVTVQSSIEEGAFDVRDDDLAAFRLAIAATGAEFVMINEACHSETLHRGPGSRSMLRPRPGPGPSEPLLPALEEQYRAMKAGDDQSEHASLLLDAVTSERFICLSAAQDANVAYEFRDHQGTAWGRFSLALASALNRLRPGGTYRELHDLIYSEFETRWPDDAQRPTLLPDPSEGWGHADVSVFGGRLRPPHARVTKQGDRFVLNEGSAAGYEPGTVLAIYTSIDAFEQGDAAIGHATVVEAGLSSAAIEPQAEVPAGAIARISIPATPPVLVYIGAGVSEQLTRALRAEPTAATVRFTDSIESASLVLESAGGGSLVVLPISAASRPGATRVALADDARVDEPLVTIRTELGEDPTASAARQVAETLDLLVRTRRFWALSGRPDDVAIDLTHPDGLPFKNANGSRITIATDEEFNARLEITNLSSESRFLYIYYTIDTGNGLAGFEPFLRGPFELGPGESWRGDTVWSPESKPGRRDVTRLKVLLTSERVNLAAALAPASQRKSHRGPTPDAFERMFERSLRSRAAMDGPVRWATGRLLVELVRPE